MLSMVNHSLELEITTADGSISRSTAETSADSLDALRRLKTPSLSDMHDILHLGNVPRISFALSHGDQPLMD